MKMKKKVLLLNMPFGALNLPAFGLSLLKAALKNQNIPCDIHYPSFSFAEFVGEEEYNWISLELPYIAFIGDWTFTRSLYGVNPNYENQYIEDVLCKTWCFSEQNINRIMHIRDMTFHFLDYCMATIPWEQYAIVGFTSTFEQNIASLSLAKRIKEKFPDIYIVFGGANWEAEMGQELHKCFSFVDFVCSGEADYSFPMLVQHILSGKTVKSIGKIPGIIYRVNNCSISTGQSEPVKDMDSLPVPDFSDYFNELNQCTVSASISPILLFETARGCWWGSKSHCMFCGLNGGKIFFRSKTPKRAIEELHYLIDRWQIYNLEAVDNIIDMKYFDNMLPALVKNGSSLQIFYEVKANLKREHIKILHEAGVCRIQPGIESLNDNILKLMRKGTTALKNIQMLKWCKEFNITAYWNLIYGFPGEKKEDYDAILELLQAIRFLEAPTGYGPVRLDRFSPYFISPWKNGFMNMRPLLSYNHLYPFDKDSLNKIAYSFDYDYRPDVDPIGFASEVIAYIQTWKCEPEMGSLSLFSRPDDTLILVDTRSNAEISEMKLTSIEKSIYELCNEVCSRGKVVQEICSKFPDMKFSEQQIFDILNSFIMKKLMVTDGKNYLSLAIPAQQEQCISKPQKLIIGEEKFNLKAGKKG